jgi:DNA polymerase-3 subunit epsilon
LLYAVVDIETTGHGSKGQKITEISALIFDGKKIVNEFTSLVNPEQNIPVFITNLTGITNAMVRNAPKFYEIAKKSSRNYERHYFCCPQCKLRL